MCAVRRQCKQVKSLDIFFLHDTLLQGDAKTKYRIVASLLAHLVLKYIEAFSDLTLLYCDPLTKN